MLLDSESLEDLSANPTSGTGAGDFDLNDELQTMQETACLSVHKRRFKKGKRYREWKADAVREDERTQL